MAYKLGTDSVVKLDHATTTLTAITNYCDKAELVRELSSADVTALGDQDRKTIPGFPNSTMKVGGPNDYADDAIFDIVNTGLGSTTTRSLEFGPEGASSGNLKLSAEVIVTECTITSAYDKPQTWDATLRVDGAVTAGTY